MAPRKTTKKRCAKGTRKCFSSGDCVVKSNIKLIKRCPPGQRQCADRKCYDKKRLTRAVTIAAEQKKLAAALKRAATRAATARANTARAITSRANTGVMTRSKTAAATRANTGVSTRDSM